MKRKQDIIALLLASFFALAPVFSSIHALEHESHYIEISDDFNLDSDIPDCDFCDSFQLASFHKKEAYHSLQITFAAPVSNELDKNQFRSQYTYLQLRGPPAL